MWEDSATIQNGKKKRKWHHELYINNIYSYKNQYITDSKEENEYEISKIYSNYKHIAILQVLWISGDIAKENQNHELMTHVCKRKGQI